MKAYHLYATSEIDWLRINYPKYVLPELVVMFNKHFGLDASKYSILGVLKRHKIKSGRSGMYKNKNTPWNKSLKGVRLSPRTEFKKGQKPHNWMPVGSERVNNFDIVQVKIAEPSKWRSKHVLIHEKYHGPTPKGSVVIFCDGNRRNFSIDNLVLVKRSELVRLNGSRFSEQHKELKPALINLAKIETRIRELEKA